VKQFY